MSGWAGALRGVPGWARAVLVVAPLLAAAGAANVEYQLGRANAAIPTGSVHGDAWKEYDRIRQHNRATLGVSAALAVALAAGFLMAPGARGKAADAGPAA